MKRRCKYMYLFMMAIISVTGQATKAQSQQLDIKEAIEIALANNYALRADSLNITLQGYKNRELAGQYLPQAKMASKMNYNIAIPTQMLPGSIAGQPAKEFIPVQFGTKYDASSGIEVSQTIYRKDLLLQIRSAGLQSEIAGTKYRLSKEDLIYNVAAAYYALQSKAELIRTTTGDYMNLKDILAIAKAQFENGTLKRIDYESLQINVANKESQLNQLLTQYNEQLDYFKYFLGLPASTSLVIRDSISRLPQPATPDEKQVPGREDIHLLNQLIQSKEVELKTVRAEKLPVISSYFKYNYQSQFSKAGDFFNNDYWFKSSSVGLSASISIFDGNRRKSRLQATQTQLLQLKLQNQQQKQLAQTELASAWQTLGNNQVQFRINAQNLLLAEKVFASRKALYAEGVTTLIELLDAERELSQARNLHMQSLINVQTGLLDVYKANGTLLTEFIKSI